MIKTKLLSIIFFLILTINSAIASTVKIDVKGLVCEFCAVTIEKSFKKKSEVKNVKVDLEKKKVFLDFNENKNLDNETITKIIVNNGYNVEKINR